MKSVYLHKNPTCTRLLLFFGGWGAEPSIFADFAKYDDCDVLMCYDYTSPDFDVKALEQYDTVDVLAWSLGVWVAAAVMGGDITVHRSIAVNGTIYPENDLYGIPEAIFEGTISNFSPDNYTRFRRRMCGSRAALAGYDAIEKQRTADELLQELVNLRKYIHSAPAPEIFRWDMAVAGSGDGIFPYDNQLNAWKACGVPVRVADVPHYGKQLFEELLDHKNGIWKSL